MSRKRPSVTVGSCADAHDRLSDAAALTLFAEKRTGVNTTVRTAATVAAVAEAAA